VASLSDLQAELAQLQAARLKVLIGRMPEQVRTADGKFMVYGKADLSRIEGRIATLEGQIAGLQPGQLGGRRPLYIRF
jgi:hypothetical protein